MTTAPRSSKSLLPAILATGLLTGTLDAVGAIINYCIPVVRNPIRIFQYIASGAMGTEAAFTGGWLSAAAGIFLHYVIATFWTALFYWNYPLIKRFLPSKVVAGILYGPVIWFVMNLAVLPLSRVQRGPMQVSSVLIGMAILILAVGLPVSWRASGYLRSVESK